MHERDDPCLSFGADDGELEGATDPRLPLVALETLLNRPPSWRKRLAQIGVLLVALGALLCTGWGSLLSSPPVNTTTAAPAAARVVSITSNVSYGTLTINGRVQHAPLPLQVALKNSTRLVVTLAASPFRPLTCTVPPAPTPVTFNPCLLSGYAPPNRRAVVVLSLLLGLEALPPPMQQQAIAVLPNRARFQEDTTVPSASSIATGLMAAGAITSQVTTAPLRAKALFTPSPLSLVKDDPSCDGRLCYVPFPAADPTAHLWAIALPVVLHWRFTTVTGQVVSDVGYPVLEGWQVDLNYDPRTGWRVPQTQDAGARVRRQVAALVCATGAALVQAQVAEMGWTISVTHLEGVPGCGLVGQQEERVQPVFVWRFGVLFVVNVSAQCLLPALPLAPPEQRAAPGG
jgi:hypothetical protein